MALKTTVLFGRPQKAIGGLILQQVRSASAVSIVTGFATPGGLEELGLSLKGKPRKLQNLIVGMATYPAFQVMDTLLAAGVDPDSLRVHLGHTQLTGGRKNPFARYRPMLHSKIYYMEFSQGSACAFIGSNNMTAFALGGKNGEAAVLLEGDAGEEQFREVRSHISEARRQAKVYWSGMKDAYAWWSRQYLEGLEAEIELPREWRVRRTIIIFATLDPSGSPKLGDEVFFEIPAGIEQIESLQTEVHLFLFMQLPATPEEALSQASSADRKYTCVVLGVDNSQGNRELNADWFVDQSRRPHLHVTPSGTHRPTTASGMQQVRAKVRADMIESLDYFFDSQTDGWLPLLSSNDELELHGGFSTEAANLEERGSKRSMSRKKGEKESWSLVSDLKRRDDERTEKDKLALERASPKAGAFIMVALRSRRKFIAHQDT